MTTMKLSLTAFSFFIIGCNAWGASEVKPKPDVFLFQGTSVYISSNETAKVYGSDVCPTGGNKMADRCTKLTRNGLVTVELHYKGATFTETWKFFNNSTGYGAKRPNGFSIKTILNQTMFCCNQK